MSEASPKFKCGGCGKEYPWREQLAGRKARCAGCGQIIDVPTAPPESDDAGMYDLAPDDTPARPRAKAAAPNLPGPVKPVEAPRAAARASSSATPMYPGVVAPKRMEMSDVEKKAQVKNILMPLAAVLLLVAVFIVGRMVLKGGSKDTTPRLGEDAQVEKLIKEDGGHEAKKWLEGPERRMFRGMARHTAQAYVDQWYKDGARKVLAFGEGMTLSVAIELPTKEENAAGRDKLFAWEKQWHEEQFIQPAKDVGQKYLHIQLKP